MIKSVPLSQKIVPLVGHRQDVWAQLLAWSLVGIYIVSFAQLALLRHASFNSSGFDLGIYDQVTWNTAQGRPFFYTTTGQPLLHLSNHASLNILPVALFYRIYSGPEMLLWLQSAAIGLGALPLFWLGREKLRSNWAGLGFLLAYLLFPTLEIVTLWDYHPPSLSVGFFMFAFYFLLKRRRGWYFFCLVLAMSGKEHLPLQAVFLGLYGLIFLRERWLGTITIGLGLAWFFLLLNWVIPANSVVGEHIFLGYYADLGQTPGEIVWTALTRPDLVWQNLWQPAKLQYLFDVLTPFAFLPLLGLPVLLIGTPSFAINLLSANTAMHDASGGQYGADVAPWLAWATVYGMIYLVVGLGKVWPDRQVKFTTVATLVLVTVATGWHVYRGFSPLSLDPPHRQWSITAHDKLAQRFLRQIPADASVAAQGKLYPHLSNRLTAYQLPDVNGAEYVFIDVTNETWPIHPNDLRTLTETLLESGQYGILDAADGYILLRRGLDRTTLPDPFYDFARVDRASPQYPVQVDFGGAIRLLGFDLLDSPRREETMVRLYWQALAPIDQDLRLYPFFLDPQGQVIETTAERPLITQLWYPPRDWQPGQIVVSQTLPWPLGEQWSLGVGVLAGADWADWGQRRPAQLIEAPPVARLFEGQTWARLATFQRRGRGLVELTSDETDFSLQPVDQVNFGDQMMLLGYDFEPDTGRPGGDVAVTLYWQAMAEMPVDYTVFVHLIGPDGQRVAQDDNAPWWEVPIPTTTWQSGETLRDRHRLNLPPELPSGSYQLQVGVYYWQTLERLPVLENDTPVNNFSALGDLVIK